MKYTDRLFTTGELEELREEFLYVDEDIRGTRRLFFDNAGGSLRLKKAEEEFHRISGMPDASEHSNTLAVYLAELEDQARRDIKEVIFNAKQGAVYPGYTASQLMMDIIKVISEHAEGTNYVTTVLEHPSSFDAMTYYACKNGCELRVAQANPETGGVDAEEILSKIDKDTAVLSCMAASNISGYIFDIETIFRRAREINPDVYIVCDAVQHAPHGALDPEQYGVDAMNLAPYKFFGVRGFALAYLSDRVASFDHYRLLGKPADDWEIGSPATAQFVAVHQVVEYVIGIGRKKKPEEQDRRRLFEAGMERIADHERALLYLMLEGTEKEKGLRYISGLKVQMDGKDLEKRDLILSVEFDRLDCRAAVREYEKRGIVTFERAGDSIYSARMLEPFESQGVVRLSPLHINTVEEVEEFLKVTKEIAT